MNKYPYEQMLLEIEIDEKIKAEENKILSQNQIIEMFESYKKKQKKND